MNHRDPRTALAALTQIEQTGVAVEPFRTAFNLREDEFEAVSDPLSLHRIGSNAEERLFAENRWNELLESIEQTLERFHETSPGLPGASLKDIQLATRPFLETRVLEAATGELTEANRIGRRAGRFHLPTHRILVSGQDRLLLDKVTTLLAPRSGSPMSLHQAAQELRVDNRVLEVALKNAVKTGEMVVVAKNRYAPSAYVSQMARLAEDLAKSSAQGSFTAAEYCKHIETGRNFAIGLLEYFDRLGFTERRENRRRIKRSAENVFPNGNKT